MNGSKPYAGNDNLSEGGILTMSIQQNDTPLDLSVVMPCLNESLTIGTCVKKALAAIILPSLGIRPLPEVSDTDLQEILFGRACE
jgi:hypothetical protein